MTGDLFNPFLILISVIVLIFQRFSLSKYYLHNPHGPSGSKADPNVQSFEEVAFGQLPRQFANAGATII
jgi:hypothetical protein